MMPICCESKKVFELWKSAARNTQKSVSGFCADCTEEYQAKMVGAKRCEHPEVRFRTDEDGFIEGYIPRVTPELRKAEQIVGAANSGPVRVYAVNAYIGGVIKRTIRIVRENQNAPGMREIDLIGVYGPGANAYEVAQDLAA